VVPTRIGDAEPTDVTGFVVGAEVGPVKAEEIDVGQLHSKAARATGHSVLPTITGGFHPRVHFRVTPSDSDSPSLY
jgi:hypothetical protein